MKGKTYKFRRISEGALRRQMDNERRRAVKESLRDKGLNLGRRKCSAG